MLALWLWAFVLSVACLYVGAAIAGFRNLLRSFVDLKHNWDGAGITSPNHDHNT